LKLSVRGMWSDPLLTEVKCLKKISAKRQLPTA
jgi:hypothetical protein